MKSKIIIVAGGTASGKTTLVDILMQKFASMKPALLALDSYYYPLTHLSLEERDKINFDHPQQFDISLLLEDVTKLLVGNECETPVYDYAIHNRLPKGKIIYPSELIFIEGILSLHFEELRKISSYNIFVDTQDSTRLERRISRDIVERGRTKESVLEWWDSKVQPMHLEFCEPSKKFAHLIVSGDTDLEKTSTSVSDAILKNISN